MIAEIVTLPPRLRWLDRGSKQNGLGRMLLGVGSRLNLQGQWAPFADPLDLIDVRIAAEYKGGRPSPSRTSEGITSARCPPSGMQRRDNR
jgi:hypothetical protein